MSQYKHVTSHIDGTEPLGLGEKRFADAIPALTFSVTFVTHVTTVTGVTNVTDNDEMESRVTEDADDVLMWLTEF